MERPIKIYNGAPERAGICRATKGEVASLISKYVRQETTLREVEGVVKRALATDKYVCIEATNPEFAKYVALSFSDLGVLLRFQETLLYSCEKWKQ